MASPARPQRSSGSPARKVTLKDVAQRAGVSPAVVSAVVSGSKNNIRMSADTRRRVDAAIAETGYQANHAAKSLRSSRTGVVAAVVPRIANPIFELAIRGMQAAAEESGGVLMLVDSDWIRPGSNLMGRIAGTGMVDGFLVRSAQLGTETIDELTERGLPSVVLQPPTVDDHTCVWVDDDAGIYTATRHLLDLGHRRIVLVGGLPYSPFGGPRQSGYRRAMEDAGLRPDPGDVYAVGFAHADVMAAMSAALRRRPRPTAAVLDNLVAASGALAAAADLGVRIPADLSVVAYHDLPAADFMRPTPTTVRMPVFEAGHRAYRTLLAMLDGVQVESGVVVRPAPAVVDRGSAIAC